MNCPRCESTTLDERDRDGIVRLTQDREQPTHLDLRQARRSRPHGSDPARPRTGAPVPMISDSVDVGWAAAGVLLVASGLGLCLRAKAYPSGGLFALAGALLITAGLAPPTWMRPASPSRRWRY